MVIPPELGRLVRTRQHQHILGEDPIGEQIAPPSPQRVALTISSVHIDTEWLLRIVNGDDMPGYMWFTDVNPTLHLTLQTHGDLTQREFWYLWNGFDDSAAYVTEYLVPECVLPSSIDEFVSRYQWEKSNLVESDTTN